MKLDALFQHPDALPTAPKLVQELIESFNSDNVSTEEIVRKLAIDQVLSAKLLRLANSAYFHVSRSIGTVEDAVSMLGFVTVRTLVISNGLVNGFKAMPGLDLKKFWRYGLHTGVVAKWLAKKAHQNGDQAFTVGLMHGIGQLVMHTAMPEQMLQLDKIAAPLDPRRLDIETTSFGYNFATVSAELARRWKFPTSFSSIIAAFPDPLEHAPVDPMACIIHLAAWRARAESNGLDANELAATFPADVAAQIGVTQEMVCEEMPPLSELVEGLDQLIS
ncbi:MAG TPA: HDOD domain-containing protein [Herbaspirillum sp.]|jgi:HD-like signal output (HDOD) protein